MLNEVMNGITVALPFVVGVGGVGVLASGYVKASPDTALIISGLRKKPKVLIGKAGIKVPFFERMDKLSLKLIPLDIKTGDAVPTADCINIYVDSAVNVKVGSTSEMVEIAAQNFLNKSIRNTVQTKPYVDPVSGNVFWGKVDSKSIVGNNVWVRIPSPALLVNHNQR